MPGECRLQSWPEAGNDYLETLRKTIYRPREFLPASPQEPLNEHRLLLATDIPFWRKSTGAQQRIASLVRYLESNGFLVRTFFLGQSGTEQFTDSDRDLIAQQDLDVDQRSSEQLPKGLADKLGWYADATLHFFQNSRSIESQSAESQSAESQSAESIESDRPMLQLKDFRWPWAMRAFSEAVKEFKPDSILIQYIKLGYLLDGLSTPTRRNIKCLVDTHDVLHRRSEQFQQRGYQHWIQVSREQESTELRKFDVIIAIQEEEAALFRKLAEDREIIICGHATYQDDRPADQTRRGEDGFTIGYLGSVNASNTHAIETFLKQVWSAMQNSEFANRIDLVIAGEICSWIESNDAIKEPDLRNVTLLGKIDPLAAFYDRIDMAINPVEFGTGLKIKCCEAIAFGKPLLTTRQGMLGMPAGCREASVACDSIEAFSESLIALIEDRGRFDRMRTSAAQLSQTEFSDQQVYSRLKQSLNQVK